jgi:acyl carrier protein
VVAGTLGTHAQQMPVVRFLDPGSPMERTQQVAAFRTELTHQHGRVISHEQRGDAILRATSKWLARADVDESAISIGDCHKPLSAAFGSTVCRGREKSGKAMDARAAPQVDSDTHKIRALIARYLGIDAEQVTDEVHFRNDFDLDSLDQLELLILIEDEFSGVEFSDTAMDQIEVVGDLIRYVETTCFAGKFVHAGSPPIPTPRRSRAGAFSTW